MREALRVLLIEDSAADARLIERHVKSCFAGARCEHVADKAALLAALERGGWDVVLSDYCVPGLPFDVSLRLVQEREPELPVIMVSGSVGEERAVEILKLGAWDFVLKDKLVRLIPAIERCLREADDRRKRAASDEAARLSQEELRDSETRFQQMAAHIEDVLYRVDCETHEFEYVSPAFTRLLGYTLDDVARMGGRERFLSSVIQGGLFEDQLRACNELKGTLSDGSSATWQAWWRCKQGDVKFIEDRWVPVYEGRCCQSAYGVLRDITARKRAEDAVRKSGLLLRQLIDLVPHHIFAKDRDGRFLFLNRAAADSAGKRPEEMEGRLERSARQDTAHVEGFLRDDRAVIDNNRPILIPEESITYPDGRTHYLQTTKIPFVPPGSDERAVLGVAIDITEQKKAAEERQALEVQLLQAQKLESLGTLAGGVAHEINNPIMGILGYAELIGDMAEQGSELAEFAAEIKRETQRVATIVRNLLNFARQERQSAEPALIHEVVDSVLSLICAVIRHDQIAIDIDVPRDIPAISCRSQQIQQVLMNLLTNARDSLNAKYPEAHADKRIIVRARAVQPHESLCGASIRLTVEDHGQGISDAVLSRIFDPFFTTKPRDKGTGLGLSISHGIVKEHGGRLSVETRLGEWTRFHVDLPLAERQPDGQGDESPTFGN